MKQLYIHIGTEKTGTKSIQKSLTVNSPVLLKNHGVLWPQHPDLFVNNGHFPVVCSLLNPDQCDFIPQKFIKDQAEIFNKLTMLSEKTSANKIVLSAEHFSSRFTEVRIEALSTALKDFDVTVVVYIRRQDKMALSYFSTSVRYGRREWLSETEINPSNKIYDIRGLLDSWAKFFGKQNIKVRIFEKNQLLGGNVVIDFLSTIGVREISDLQDVNSRENKALTIKQLKLLIELNKRLPTWDEAMAQQNEKLFRTSQKIRENLIRTLDAMESFSDSSGANTLFSTRDRQKILDRFTADNDYIARIYGSEFEQLKSSLTEFPQPTNSPEKPTPEITRDDMVDVMIKCLSSQI